MMPRVEYPQGVETPDFLFRGERFDLKTLEEGTSKNTVYNRLNESQNQADNFILDISNSPLGADELIRQSQAIFTSRHTRRINKIFLINGNEIILVLERKK